jgi:hypothetical protein
VTPELINKYVLVKGIVLYSKTFIETGGQIPPIAKEGAKLEWKNAQKKAKKNIT